MKKAFQKKFRLATDTKLYVVSNSKNMCDIINQSFY